MPQRQFRFDGRPVDSEESPAAFTALGMALLDTDASLERAEGRCASSMA